MQNNTENYEEKDIDQKDKEQKAAIKRMKEDYGFNIHLADTRSCILGLIYIFVIIVIFLFNKSCMETYDYEITNMIISLVVIGIINTAIIVLRLEFGAKLKNYLSFIWFFTCIFLCVEISGVVSIRYYDFSEIIFFKNIVIYAALFFIVLGIIGKIKFSIIFSFSIWWVVLLIDMVIIQLRGTPIVPSDIYSVNTALNVATSYKFNFTVDFVNIVQVLFLVIMITMLYCSDLHTIKRRFIIRGISLCMCFLSVLFIQNFTYEENSVGFYQQRFNEKYGVVYNFLMNINNMKIQKPDFYDKEETAILANSDYYTQNENSLLKASSEEKVTPNVIVVMNESFSDLRIYNDINTSKDVMPFFDSMDKMDNTIKGNMVVSAFGGGTCNTEFEFLTGFSMAFFPFGSIPYNQYIKQNIPSMCTHLSGLGFTANAFHPYWSTSWQRDVNYKYLGFDNFISGEDYLEGDINRGVFRNMGEKDFGDSVEYIRNYISDKQDYNDLIDMYEKKDENPLFTFNITIQNHGGYCYYEDDFMETVRATDYEIPTLDQYLTLVNMSDEALKDLVNYFKEFDEPTVLLFFGDHQPSLQDEFYDEFVGKEDADMTPEELQRKYTVPYVIWANYDLNTVEVPELISPNYLQNVLYDASGIKQSNMSSFTKEMMEKYPAMNYNYLMNSKGEWITIEEALEDEDMQKYNNLVYYYMFDGN